MLVIITTPIIINSLNMIAEIKITDLNDAESYAFGPNNKYDVWVSAIDEDDEHKMHRMKKLLNKKGVKHFFQFFYDFSDEDENIFYVNKNIEDVGPRKDHIKSIIDFLKPFVEDDKVHNLGVNCFAGVSRSTAIGIIASVMSGKTPDMALDYIKTIRPMAWPNLRVLRFASEILGKDLKTPVEKWKKLEKGNLYTGGFAKYEE
jgi:predicted protein tyrosine phosphatase